VVPADFDSTEQLYKEWVLQAGLTICDWAKERVDVVFHNEDEMRSWMEALFFDLSDDEFERLFEGHLRLVHGHYPQAGDGRIYAFPHRLTMILQK